MKRSLLAVIPFVAFFLMSSVGGAMVSTDPGDVASGPVAGEIDWDPVTMEDLINPAPGEWPTFGRTGDNLRYSPLDQINKENVGSLRTAWARNLNFSGASQFSPIVVNGVMFIGGNDNTVAALDATNGELIWEYTPRVPEAVSSGVNRGVAVFGDKVFYNRTDAVVVALDAKTGDVVWENQVANWEQGYGFSSPPVIAHGKVVVGTTGADSGGANGLIIALDAETGEQLWKFDVIPQPGEPGNETWEAPGSWEYGGGSPWAVGSYDAETRTVVWSTGQPTPWLWSLHPGDNLYTNTILGLDADTGDPMWYYQVIPNETWDYDEAQTNILAELEIDGEMRDVVIHFSKHGFFEVLDRNTGEFLHAHQFAYSNVVQGFDEEGNVIINPENANPKADEENFFCPSVGGGANWMSGAYSPETGLVYMPTNETCNYLTLNEVEYTAGQPFSGASYRLTHAPGYDYVGEVEAIDPVTGEQAWSFKSERGWTGATLVTSGGLVFAGSLDRTFRAFDAENGDVLWQQIVNATIESHPITYSVDGKQYIAVATGCCGPISGGLSSITPELPFPSTDGQVLWVFTLPEEN